MCTYSYAGKNLLISSIALSIVHLVNLEPIPLMSHLTRNPLITNPLRGLLLVELAHELLALTEWHTNVGITFKEALLNAELDKV